MKKLLSSAAVFLLSAISLLAQTYTVTPSVTNYAAAGGQVTFTVNLSYPAGAGAVSFSAKPPGAGWAHVATAGTNPPAVSPAAGETTDPADPASVLGWSYQDIPPNGTASFTFTVSYPAGLTGSQAISFKGQYNANNVSNPVTNIAPISLEPQPVAPSITTQPANQSVASGQNATFTAAASGVPTPTLKWQRSTDGGATWANVDDGSGFAGTTTGTLTVNAVTLAMTNHRFRVVATSAGSPAVNSNGAILTVTQAPQITQQPVAQAVLAGESAVFSITATGSGTISYKWYFTPSGSSTPQQVNGAAGPVLTIANVQQANVGDYVAVLNNGVGTDVTSNAAALSIVPRVVRILNQTAAPGTNVVVPIQLVASGTENTVTFGLHFNPSKMSYVSHAAPAEAGVSVTPNISQKDNGQLGFLVGRSPGEVHAAGAKIILNVTFSVAAGAQNGESIAVTFADTPSLRRIFSVDGPQLPGAFVDGSVGVASGLEGDINGDGEVDGGDWVLLGRIVVGLNPTPTSGLSFMRADCAPRATKGDGTVDGGDWVQLGRYVVGLDLIQTTGGPTVPAP